MWAHVPCRAAHVAVGFRSVTKVSKVRARAWSGRCVTLRLRQHPMHLGSKIAEALKNVESEKLRTAEILPNDLSSAKHTRCGQRSWPWSEELDALIATSEYHTLLLENERVRVLDVRIPAGRTVPVHTHCWPSVLYLLSAGDFIRRDSEGTILLDTRSTPPQIQSSPPSIQWSPPLPPHSVQNVGKTEIRVVSVEIKNQS
jgi:hypothetical protein